MLNTYGIEKGDSALVTSTLRKNGELRMVLAALSQKYPDFMEIPDDDPLRQMAEKLFQENRKSVPETQIDTVELNMEQVEKWLKLGYTKTQIAKKLVVSVRQLNKGIRQHKELKDL